MTEADKFRLEEIRATWTQIGHKPGTIQAVAKLDVMFLLEVIDRLTKHAWTPVVIVNGDKKL